MCGGFYATTPDSVQIREQGCGYWWLHVYRNGNKRRACGSFNSMTVFKCIHTLAHDTAWDHHPQTAFHFAHDVLHYLKWSPPSFRLQAQWLVVYIMKTENACTDLCLCAPLNFECRENFRLLSSSRSGASQVNNSLGPRVLGLMRGRADVRATFLPMWFYNDDLRNVYRTSSDQMVITRSER